MSGPDVRWDGVPHQTIVDWVSNGPGAALTKSLEQWLKAAEDVFDHASNLTNSAIQRAGGEWQGATADVATDAMRALRNFTDGMFFTSKTAGIHAFGQSDGAGFVRTNVPPVVQAEPPKLTGGLMDVIGSTIDFQHQQAAAKQAEQRAREIMEQYSAATKDRVAAMTPLTPVPQVVLTTASTSVGPPPVVGPPPRPHDPGPKPDTGAPEGNPGRVGGPVQPHGGGPAQTHAPTPGGPPAPTAPPAATRSAQAPGIAPPSAHEEAEAGPVRLPAADSTGLPTVGPYGGKFSQGLGTRSIGLGVPEEKGAPATGRGPVDTAVPGRAGTARGGVPRAAGSAAPYGLGATTKREEDRDRPAKYGLPSADHFEPDDPALDPYRAGWFVAPDVIGDQDEDDNDK
jgi:hypothetical protein